MEIAVALFTSSSKAGIALESDLKENLSLYLVKALEKVRRQTNALSAGLSLIPVFHSIKRCALEIDFFKAQLECDLVIFDGSLEEDGLKLGDNYSCVGHAPYLLDNVIVVSRTVLPINYIPNETNVPPIGEEEQIEENLPKKNYTNIEICSWLTDRFCQWIIAGRLPRKSEYKRRLPPLEKLFNGADDVASIQWLVKEASEISEKTQIYKQNRYEHTAFISYRSYYYHNTCNGYSVKELGTYILEYHKKQNPNENWKVLYYPQGSLAQDCMTEYRRWSLMTYVDNIFKEVPEVWIFDTHDPAFGPSYWDSWFTQGEIISLMMLHQSLPELCPKIFEFNPSTGKHREIHLRELPLITGINKDDLNLITANSEILYGDYSGLIGMQRVKEKAKEMSFLKRKLFFKMINKKLGFNVEKSFRSHSYDSSFMTTRLISCSHCVRKGNSFASFSDPDFIRTFIHIGSENAKERKEIAQRGYFSLNEAEFQAALEVGQVRCPQCGRTFLLQEGSNCFYIWRHMFHNPEIDFDGYVEKVSLYHISEQ